MHRHHRHYERGQVWRLRRGKKMRRRRLEGLRARIDFLSHCLDGRYCVAVVTVFDERPPPPPGQTLAVAAADGVTVSLRDLGELLPKGDQ